MGQRIRKKETPFSAKILAGITVVYALSPIDIIPDFIPVLGYIDDLIILPALVVWTVKLIPAEVFTACREESKNLWNGRWPKKWYFAISVVLIWAVIVLLVIKAIVG